MPWCSAAREDLDDDHATATAWTTGLAIICGGTVTETPERAVDYGFKTILRGRVSYDDGVLLLPRAHDELAPARKSETGSLMGRVFTR
jgi:hypothetical protein